jgi:hypothetical protein
MDSFAAVDKGGFHGQTTSTTYFRILVLPSFVFLRDLRAFVVRID